MNIKLYSTGCPVCNVIKKLLDDKKIPYDCIEDKNEILKIGEKNSISSVPFAFIDNKLYKTNELREFIMNEGGIK